MKTDAKSNEISAISPLLSLLDIHDCLISIDAMVCQTAIVAQIIEQGGHYRLAVNSNQERLSNAVREAFKPVLAELHIASIEQNWGRVEVRQYHVIPAELVAHYFPEWKGLRTQGVAVGYQQKSKGEVSLAYRYYISSAPLDRATFVNAVRCHWGIENQLH